MLLHSWTWLKSILCSGETGVMRLACRDWCSCETGAMTLTRSDGRSETDIGETGAVNETGVVRLAYETGVVRLAYHAWRDWCGETGMARLA